MVKAAVAVLLGAFVVFYIMNSPTQAADMVHNVWHTTVAVAHGFAHFFDRVAS